MVVKHIIDLGSVDRDKDVSRLKLHLLGDASLLYLVYNMLFLFQNYSPVSASITYLLFYQKDTESP